MKIALCNEVLRPLPFERQCEVAAQLGYDGLEIAPFTLAPDPTQLSDAQGARFARIAAEHGLHISGLHWLLVAPEGLSITAAMQRLVDLCAAMGGRYLVHGSPAQRAIAAGTTREQAWERARECLRAAAHRAAACGVVYCLEPLSPRETPFVNTIGQAVRMVEQVDSPGLRTMIDCSAAGQSEAEPVAALIERWMPTGRVAHVQVNDPNRRGPGQGEMAFAPILRSLRAMQMQGHCGEWIAVEPFDYVPDGAGCAARAIGYLRGVLEGLDHGR